MSNGQLYTAAGTQVVHPPPYNSYIATGNPSIKQEYASSPTVDDQSRDAAAPPSQSSQNQQQAHTEGTI